MQVILILLLLKIKIFNKIDKETDQYLLFNHSINRVRIIHIFKKIELINMKNIISMEMNIRKALLIRGRLMLGLY